MNINGLDNNESTHDIGENQHPCWLSEFVSVYQHLSTDNLDLIDSIYDPDIHFVDPMHELHGRTQLLNYFEGLYQNLNYCRFIIDNVIQQENEAAIYWEMTYQHKTLNKGKMVTVRGSSHLKAHNGKIIYHRDYLDLGAMLYEQLPLVGQFIRWIKNKASK